MPQAFCYQKQKMMKQNESVEKLKLRILNEKKRSSRKEFRRGHDNDENINFVRIKSNMIFHMKNNTLFTFTFC